MKINLSNLAEASRQQVFDQVTKHLLTQNETSKAVGGACAYRSADGNLMCAAGCLIGDDEYIPAMDDFGCGLDWGGVVARGYAPSAHENLIEDLQDIHDNSHPNSWEDRLRDYADNEGLIFKGVQIDYTV